MKETKALTIPKDGIDSLVANYISFLDSVPMRVKASLKQDPKQAINILHQVELVEIGAQKAKMKDVIAKAKTIKLKSLREVGLFVVKNIKGGKHTENDLTYAKLNLTKFESQLYQSAGSIQDYHWNYVVENYSSVRSIIREYTRYNELVRLFKLHKIENYEKKLHDCIIKGTDKTTLELLLSEKTKKRRVIAQDADEEWDSDYKGTENEESSEEETEEVTVDTKLRKNIEMLNTNTEDIATYMQNLADYLHSVETCNKDQFSEIAKSINKLGKQFNRVLTETKKLKERLTK